MNRDLKIAKKTIQAGIKALKKLSNSLNYSSQFSKAVNLCSKANKIGIIGIGKSKDISLYIGNLFSSLNIPAVGFAVQDLSHGGLGFFSKGDDGLLSGIIKTLEEEEGFKVVGVDSILSELIAGPGILGAHFPSNDHELDIIRGIDVLYRIGSLDIGQSVVISQEVVLAVEAAEGTEEMLIRCKSISNGGNGGVLIKLPKPGQEKRVDMPAIGPRTVQKAKESGLSGIAIAANLTLVIEAEKTIELANKEGLFIIGLNPNDYKADYVID